MRGRKTKLPIERILEMYRNGINPKEIALKFGVHPTAIKYHINKNEPSRYEEIDNNYVCKKCDSKFGSKEAISGHLASC